MFTEPTHLVRDARRAWLEILCREAARLMFWQHRIYNPQIQFFPKSETKRPKIALSHKTKRSENRKRTTPKMQPEKVAFLVSTNRLRQALK